MNDLQSSPESRIPGHELDGMLRRFFRAEMPEPWPTMQPPPPLRQERPSARGPWRPGARLVLAASLGFLLGGYLTLAGMFPQPAPRGDGDDRPESQGPAIGLRPLLLDTRGGAKALSWEQKVPDGELLLMQEMTVPKSKP